jgi:hypothetical protein
MRFRLACLLVLLSLSGAARAVAGPPTAEPALDDGLARGCVAAAWRASGLGEDDARIESMIARSNTSALLPEASMRAMQLWSDASHLTTFTASDSTTLYDALGTRFVLEVRLTWRLERLLYAGEEAALERIRLERHEARARLAAKALDALFAWARARADAADAVPGSRESLEAHLRVIEAHATLDVLTAGWFSARGSSP